MPYDLELISIRCNDAQEVFDEACLRLNGSMIWRYPAMQTGLTYPFGGGRGSTVSFERELSLELWEEDSVGSDDHIGSLNLSEHRIEEMISIEHPPFTHTFSRDRGIIGDASYTLTYDIQATPSDDTVMSGRYFMFESRDGEFMRYRRGHGPDPGYPLAVSEVWRGYPSSWLRTGPSAALFCHENQKIYLFSQDEYVRHSYRRGPDPTYPKSIRDFWSGYPADWRGLASALYYPVLRKFYLFWGDEYVRHSFGRGPDPEYPRSIREHWSGLPDSWGSDIYAATYCSANDKFYIFGGSDEYVRHSYGRGPDPDYPRSVRSSVEIPERWVERGFVNFSAIFYYPYFF